MQKLSGFIAASALVVSGLVAATGTAAQAAPYQTVPTETIIDGPKRVERCDKARFTVRVNSTSNRSPRGKVLLIIRRDRGGFRYTDVQKLRGGETTFTTPKLCKRRGYTVKAKYSHKPGSRWSDSKHFDSFRVVRR